MDDPGNREDRSRHDLLGYLSTHAYDEDYAWVAARRRSQERPDAGHPGQVETLESGTSHERRRIGPMGATAVAVFALLVAVAAAQTSRNASANEEQRRELIGQVDAARSQLDGARGEVRRLERQTNQLQKQQLGKDSSAQALLAQIRRLGVRAGTVAVTGPGVLVVVDDAPDAESARSKVLDSDLQRLANGFWEAGAEGIAINGQRLTNLSAIRLAGSAITVNNRSLRRPYVLSAIGDPDTLPARFAETSSGQAWLDLQRQVGLRLTITTRDSVRLPAADGVTLRHVKLAQSTAGRTS